MLQKIQCMHVHTRMGCSEVKAKYNQYLKISTFMWHKANRYQFFIWMSKFKGSKLKKNLSIWIYYVKSLAKINPDGICW